MTHTREPVLQDDPVSMTIRDQFPILHQGDGDPLVYLDNAATTQKPQAVLDAITTYYTTVNSNVGRGYHTLGLTATDRYEDARETVRAAIGAERADEIVFTASCTAATNLLAETIGRRLVGAGDQVVITGMEHNSNLLPWRRLCETTGAELVVVPVGADGRVAAADFAAAMGERVRIAAIAHVSNVLGTVNPVEDMVAVARGHGVVTVVDGAQAVAHREIDVTSLGADFYTFSAHKMYGPMGIGVLYGRWELLGELPPHHVGGGTVKAVSLAEPVRYVGVPARLEAGTPNVAGAIGLAAAFDFLSGLGRDRVRAHDVVLTRAVADAIDDLDTVRIVGEPEKDPCGIVSLVVDGIHPYDVGSHLDAHGIAVRCGVHCASTFLDSMDMLGTVRLSFAVYNTVDEIERVRAALRTVRPGFWTAEHPKTRFL